MPRNCKVERTTAVFAHRGCTGSPGPRENTLDAFRAARRAGADGVELDVRATADGALAVHHDRQVPGVGALTNVPVSALPDDVPLLDDALEACSGLRVNVEIKGGPSEAALVAGLLVARGANPGGGATEVFVSSFDAASVATVRRLAPEVPAGLLVDWRTDVGVALDHALRLGCATLHPFVTQVDVGLAGAARQRGLGLHVWTVNADADVAAMAELGVDAIITDRVAAAIAIVRGERAGPDGRHDGRHAGRPNRNGGGRAG